MEEKRIYTVGTLENRGCVYRGVREMKRGKTTNGNLMKVRGRRKMQKYLINNVHFVTEFKTEVTP